MPREVKLRIERALWAKARRVSADYAFRAGDLLNWILESESDDLDRWAKELHVLSVKSEQDAVIIDEDEDES